MKIPYSVYPWNCKNSESIASASSPVLGKLLEYPSSASSASSASSPEDYSSYKERINAKPKSFASSKDYIESGIFIL